MEPVAQLGLVDIGADNGKYPLVGDNWKIGTGVKCGPAVGAAVDSIDDRLPRRHGARRLSAEFGQIDEPDTRRIGYKL